MELSTIQADGTYTRNQLKPVNNFGTSQSGEAALSATSGRLPTSLQRFRKGEPRILGAMQILIGVFQIGLGGILAYLTEHLGFNRVLTGLPFCSGLVFIVSGALTIAADLTGFLILMRSSLGMSTVGIVSAAAAIVGLSIDLFLVYGEHSTRHECESRGQQMIDDGLSKCLFAILYAASEGIITLLLLSALLGFCIVSSSYVFGCRAAWLSSPSSHGLEDKYVLDLEPPLAAHPTLAPMPAPGPNPSTSP